MTLPHRPAPAPQGLSQHAADGIPQELLSRALAATSEISLITDAEQKILHASRSFTTITGYAEAEVLGSNCRLLQGPGTAPEAVQAIRSALSRGEKFYGDILNYRKDGSPFWNALKITPLLNDAGQVTHFVSVQRDVSTRMALQEQLRFQTTHDQLTGLPNRAALDSHLGKVLEPDGGSRPAVAVGVINLDRFKQLNNTLGHETGDAVLAEWTARMQAALQEGEFLARMGGDEFVLVVEDVPEPEAPQRLADVLQRLGQTMEQPFHAAGADTTGTDAAGTDAAITITMSAGLVLSPRDGVDMRTLLRNADAALKVSKSQATAPLLRWHLDAADPADRTSAKPAGTVAAAGTGSETRPAPDVASAADVATYKDRLFNGGLEMFMQPAVDLRDGSVYLFESLARLRLSDGTFVPPAAFLPHLGAGEVDLLFRLGLDQALGRLAEWETPGEPLKVSVNLAPSTLLVPGCRRFIEETLDAHGIAPQRLVLELLETETMDSEILSGPLNALVEMGVGLAMDDLGAGYSSLKRLSLLPFTSVKIDRDMLTGLRSNPLETLSLIATLIQIGRDFDMTVVAEGLEDRALTEAVAVLGARYGQGYHVARPMPGPEVPQWLAEFAARPAELRIRTALGALAYHWKYLRLGSPHPAGVQDCPFSGYLDFRGGQRGDVDRWHAQQHTASRSTGASRMIVDWLIREIRS